MNSGFARVSMYGLGLMTMVLALQSRLLAGFPTYAPEIDGASISAGVGLVAAAVLILRSRRHSK